MEEGSEEKVAGSERRSSEATKAVDKAIAKGVLHKNTGARRKSRMSKYKQDLRRSKERVLTACKRLHLELSAKGADRGRHCARVQREGFGFVVSVTLEGHAAGARCDSLLEGATCCDDVWLHRVNKNA